MKKFLYSAVAIAAVLSTACKKDVSSGAQKPLIVGASVDTLVGEITTNTTVTRTTYLKGIVFVKPGVVLTVNPGVTIKGSQGGATPDLINLENNKGTLIVEKGGQLVANGTPSSPIVWTSVNAAGSRNFGDWGGIVVLGNAPIITRSGATTNIFEAFRVGTNPDQRFTYGGTNAADNSGSITYNRIEFAGGVVLIANQEVNGLTFSGVGSGTTVHHVEVANSGDDAFEFFGGTVNADHLLSFSNKDDDFDFDEAYQGRLQFIIAYRSDLADNSGSEWIENDNNGDALVFNGTRTTPFISNATFIGPSSLTVRPGVTGTFDGGIYSRRAAQLRLVNSVFIANALTNVVASTPSTQASFLADTFDPLASPVLNNIFFGVNTATPVVQDVNESNSISLNVNNDLFNKLAANGNTAADPKLNGFLVPGAGSPALSGAVDVSGFGFTATAQRGAVRTTDQWTTGAWISIASN